MIIVWNQDAGTGSFYKILPINKRLGLDIEPKCEGVKKINYFDYNPDSSKKYLVIEILHLGEYLRFQ